MSEFKPYILVYQIDHSGDCEVVINKFTNISSLEKYANDLLLTKGENNYTILLCGYIHKEFNIEKAETTIRYSIKE